MDPIPDGGVLPSARYSHTAKRTRLVNESFTSLVRFAVQHVGSMVGSVHLYNNCEGVSSTRHRQKSGPA